MNLCGPIIAAFARQKGFAAQQLLVIHDELDFPCGKAKFKLGGGAGGHNGLRSISHHLNSSDYWRLRIGIGKPPTKEMGKEYVLQSPTSSEWERINMLIPSIMDSLKLLVSGQSEIAMNQLHRCLP